MNFIKKEFSIWCVGLILFTMSLGMNYLYAQSAGGPQPVATTANQAASAQATPLRTPHHQHKKPVLDQKVVGEGTPPGYPANTPPSTSITQVAP